MSANVFDQVVDQLEAGLASTRCDELVRALETLGFRVVCKTNGKHHVFFHAELSKNTDFKTGSFDGGHGRNAEVKSVYIRNVLRVLGTYESEIKKLLGE